MEEKRAAKVEDYKPLEMDQKRAQMGNVEKRAHMTELISVMEFKSRRVKLDYNHLLEQIDDVLSECESAQERGTDFGIAVGLTLLSTYLREIAERAIEIEDEVLLGLLKDLYIIKESKG